MTDPGPPIPPGTGRHTVLVVDDHPVVIDGVRAVLETAPELTVVGEAVERAVALSEAARLRPSLVVLDLRMHGDHAPDTAARIKAASPGARVLLHTATEELEPVRAALDAGADGAVFKDSRLLVEAARAVLGGASYVDPRLTRRDPSDGRRAQQVLSPREYELLRAFADGKTTRGIAAELYLTESTVRSYVKSLMVKLGVHSRIEALAEARRLGLL